MYPAGAYKSINDDIDVSYNVSGVKELRGIATCAAGRAVVKLSPAQALGSVNAEITANQVLASDTAATEYAGIFVVSTTEFHILSSSGGSTASFAWRAAADPTAINV